MKTYFLTNQSLNVVLTMYSNEFEVHNCKWTAENVIQQLVSKFEHTDSVLDDKVARRVLNKQHALWRIVMTIFSKNPYQYDTIFLKIYIDTI